MTKIEEQNIEWILNVLRHWVEHEGGDRSFAHEIGVKLLDHIEELEQKTKTVNDLNTTTDKALGAAISLQYENKQLKAHIEGQQHWAEVHLVKIAERDRYVKKLQDEIIQLKKHIREQQDWGAKYIDAAQYNQTMLDENAKLGHEIVGHKARIETMESELRILSRRDDVRIKDIMCLANVRDKAEALILISAATAENLRTAVDDFRKQCGLKPTGIASPNLETRTWRLVRSEAFAELEKAITESREQKPGG